ncbi:hypothetical protein [Methylobacterium sp. JK268]
MSSEKPAKKPLSAPLTLTPDQIAQVAAGTVLRGGSGGTTTGRIPVEPVVRV